MAPVTECNFLREIKHEMRSLNIDVKPVQEIQKPPKAYKNNSGPPRGAILIANYRIFNNNDKTRYGSEIDVENLTNLFSQMGYKVVEGIEDYTKNETMTAMKSFSEHKIHERVDSMILVVMSHGIIHDYFLTSDGQYVSSREVYELFNDKNCPALKGKPKMFIFKHCRGKNIPNSVLSIGPESSTSQENRHRMRDKKYNSDMFLLYSSGSSEGCYLNKHYGSPYIFQICRVFMENAWQSELANLMKELEKGMLKYYQKCVHKIIKKKKDFYFNPESIEYNDAKEKDQTECKNDTEMFDEDGVLEIQLSKEHGLTASSSTSKMDPSTKNHALLMNNLEGCGPDMEKLKFLLISLGYNDIETVLNVTYEKLKEVIKAFKAKEHGESAFIIFYGDGFDDYIVTADHYAIHLNELEREFNDTNCPNLSNKPKIFINNLCSFEGNIKYECTYPLESYMGQEEIESDSQDWLLDGHNGNSNECIQQLPPESNMFFINVEMEGSRCENGSLLTEAFYQVLMENNSPAELIKIMCSVSDRIDELQEKVKEDYICELQTINFPSDFYISPINAWGDLALSPKMNTIERWQHHPWKAVKANESKKVLKHEENFYKNRTETQGPALIINLPYFNWRNVDAFKFKKVFNTLGYNVKICNDTTLQGTTSCLDEFVKLNEHSNYNNSLILIMGHRADLYTLFTNKGNNISLQDVYGKLKLQFPCS